MGGLLSRRNEEDYLADLITLSNNTLADEVVFRTMMKSSYNLNELISLYKRFVELDVNKRGVLTHNQFLGLAELRNAPFRKRLPMAIPFKDEEFVRTAAKLLGNGIMDDYKPPIIEESRSKSGKVGTRIAPEPQIIPIQETGDADNLAYIDFEQFCVYLAPFCPRCPIDLKINFIFRLFDTDNDGNISKQDLFKSIQLLIGHIMSNLEIEEVVKNIFLEVDSAEKGQIDKEDLAKVLWLTDFDIKTSIDFTRAKHS